MAVAVVGGGDEAPIAFAPDGCWFQKESTAILRAGWFVRKVSCMNNVDNFSVFAPAYDASRLQSRVGAQICISDDHLLLRRANMVVC